MVVLNQLPDMIVDLIWRCQPHEHSDRGSDPGRCWSSGPGRR